VNAFLFRREAIRKQKHDVFSIEAPTKIKILEGFFLAQEN
jgi:hypothetical protein